METGDGWEDTGEPDQGFPHIGEYDEDTSVSILLSGRKFGAFQFCDEGSAAFTVRPNGELSGQASCTSFNIGETLSLAFSGGVTPSGSVGGEVAVQQISEPFKMVGVISDDELKLSWEGAAPNTALPFELLAGDVSAFKD